MFIINNKKNKKKLPLKLANISKRDKPWDTHRAQADAVKRIYVTTQEFEKYAKRIDDCTEILRFGQKLDLETGEISLKLRETKFCRVRHCPVCQWRRSLMWRARFFKAIPFFKENFPKSRWLFLTLTVKNCEVTDLKQTLQEMRTAWRRLIKRKEFSAVQGWIRATEITKGEDGSAHPHFHAMLMVPPSWFTGKYYVKQERWGELWKECARLSYAPIVDIRTVRDKGGAEGNGLEKAITETLKYAVKPSDMTADPEWFLEMTRQVHKLRFIASGGVLKEVLKESQQESDDDLALLNEGEAEDNGARMGFKWDKAKHYRRYQKADRPPL